MQGTESGVLVLLTAVPRLWVSRQPFLLRMFVCSLPGIPAAVSIFDFGIAHHWHSVSSVEHLAGHQHTASSPEVSRKDFPVLDPRPDVQLAAWVLNNDVIAIANLG